MPRFLLPYVLAVFALVACRPRPDEGELRVSATTAQSVDQALGAAGFERLDSGRLNLKVVAAP